VTGMLAIIRSELTKIRTLPSVWIITGILLSLSLLFQYQVMTGNMEALKTLDADGMHWWYDRPVPADLNIIDSMASVVFSPGIFFAVLGAVIAGAEFRTGQLGVSVLAVPSRSKLVIGKTIATALYALLFGLIFTAMTILFTYFAVKDWQPDLIWRSEALVNMAGAGLFIIAVTLITLGITLITRRTLFGILVMGGLIGTTISQAIAAFAPAVDALTPISAARNFLLQNDGMDIGGPPFSSSPTIGALVLSGWVILAFIGSIVTIQRRDSR
jgi:ABC-2 type transport system permease protein